MKNLNHYVSIYQAQLQKGDILIAYRGLAEFMRHLRGSLAKHRSDEYTIGSMHGYMDYTYFYYTNAYLKSKKLKLALVLNHIEMRLEVWLLGNTKDIQKMYWLALKDTAWNQGRAEMPDYSIVETVIETKPDFDDFAKLTHKLEAQMIQASDQLITIIRELSL